MNDLNARIDEDEAAMLAVVAREDLEKPAVRTGARMLREVAVKRQIVALCETETDQTGGKPLATRILHLLASIYDEEAVS